MTADLTYAQGLDSPVLVDLTEKPLGWQDFAACAEVDPEVHFPESRGATYQAKAICDGCPVTGECLAYQLAYERTTPKVGHLYGVFGGLSAREREVIIVAERREARGAAA